MVKKLLLLGLLIIASYFSLPKTATASTLLYDDFNDGNANDGLPVDWEEHLGSGGSWTVQNNEYRGMAIKNTPEYLPTYSLAGDENWKDYKFEVKVYGEDGIDKTVLFRYHSMNETYRIAVISSWPDWYGDKIYLTKQLYGNTIVAGASFINKQKTWYKLSIELHGSHIKLYIDDSSVPIIDYIDTSNPILTGKVGLLAEPGFYAGWNSVTINRFDDVLVCDFNGPCEIPTPTPTPTLTPTPTPTPTPQLDNLILLPGMGASWNHEAMILNQEKEPEYWHMTPGVKAYDGLIQTFKNAGYKTEGENKNLFIFNYDWRKPVEEIAEDLKEYIGHHPPLSGGKIDLVGHSLGGLAARVYVQNNLNNYVDQLITIGSPHQGAVKAYYLWEGAQLSEGLAGWQRIGAGILLQLNKRGFETRIEALRHTIPSLKDLLPTFSYLKQNGVVKPITDMKIRNFWLENLDRPPLPTSLLQNLNTIAGIKTNSTLRWINIQKRDNLDKLLGRWEDGKPIGKENSTGDDTVLDFSATVENAANIVNLPNLNHKDLVESDTGQQTIVDILQLNPSQIIEAPSISYIPSLVFQIASPATITVYDPNFQKVAEDQKLVVIPNAQVGSYQVDVYPENGGGNYRLLIGKITEKGDIWSEIDGRITNGSQTYMVGFDPELKNTKNGLIHLALDRLEIAKAISLNQRKSVRSALSAQIEVRIKDLERILSFLEERKTKQATGEIEQAIFSLSRLETFINQWPQTDFMPPEEKTEILYLIREAKDYLLQTYELE